jgi:hypothetical protein
MARMAVKYRLKNNLVRFGRRQNLARELFLSVVVLGWCLAYWPTGHLDAR